MAKLWGGRFEEDTDNLFEVFSESVSFDSRLAFCDIRGSIAHAEMLGNQGIITKKDARAIVKGLETIREDIESGSFDWDIRLEDVHTNIEAALVERVGEAGKRLHTGRSRNDQVATDLRLWLRERIDETLKAIGNAQRALLDLGEKHADAILPGCTHLQHAQPVLFAHHLLAYFEMLARDKERFAECRKRVNVMPLGSAALAGTPYPIDRKAVAKALDFDSISANSMDAVGDRDFVIEFLSAAAITMMHLSRFCEELVLWSAPPYAFIEIGDAFTTGSSIMPQKKNPDAAELVRGKTGRVYGALTALLTLMKGLPMTYNRDLQEDKEPLFDAADTLLGCLAVTARMVPTIGVNEDRMLAMAAEGFLEATDLADYLAAKNVPFREAHRITGTIVLDCARDRRRLADLSTEELRGYCLEFGDDARALLTPGASVKRRNQPGGTAPTRVRAALKRARKRV